MSTLMTANSIHNLFESQAQNSSTSIAISFEEEQLTYEELDQRSNNLAHYLKELEVSQDVLVGVFMERSIDMLVALLGILKAGGAYVPLDPDYPEDRILYMIEHSRAPIIITQESLREALPQNPSRKIYIDSEWQSITKYPDTSLALNIDPNQLAYVMYTSGSTGKPKGVQVQHEAVVNFLTSMAQKPGVTSKDILVAVTTLSFDISVLELFLPISVGSQVILASKEVASDGEKLRDLLSSSKASVMQATPTTWRLLIAADWQGSDTFKALCGGEALPPDLMRQLLERTGSAWNMYGPTETTIWSTCYELTDPDKPVLIGRPIANTPVYILDKSKQPVPIGVEGELYIGGIGVTRGYLYQEDLTQEKFVRDPFSSLPASRMYRTGDLVRYHADGNIEYRNRIDNQVKVRGYRIELGEIETALSRFPTIFQCAVTAREYRPGDVRLAAYLVPDKESKLVQSELIEFLSVNLPEYMIPSHFVEMEALPLTPNGKINRKALPNISEAKLVEDSNYLAPRNEVEDKIAHIWSEALAVEQVGVESDFFDLGGHSLLVTQVWSRIKRLFQIRIKLGEIFAAPTVAEQAVLVASLLAQDVPEKIESVEQAVAGTNQLSLSQWRFWYIDQITSDLVIYNLCASFKLLGKLNIDALSKSIQAISQRHSIMRAHIEQIEGIPQIVIDPDLTFDLGPKDFEIYPSEVRDDEAYQYMEKLARQPFDLSTGPLIRTELLRLAPEEHTLFFMPHHVIWDGWSFDIFLRELREHYTAFVDDRKPVLADVPIKYADYCGWQQQWMESEEMKEQLAYWKDQLAGDLPTLQLPADFPRPPEFTYQGAIKMLQFPDHIVQGLANLAAQQGATMNMIILAAYKALWYRYTGMEDVIVGTPIQARTRPELEDLIGLFVNTLVIRTNVEGSLTFREVLDRVREVCHAAYSNQDFPFEHLVESLAIDRDISRTPIFQTLFTFQEVSNRIPHMSDIQFQQIHLHTGACPTDISFWVQYRENWLLGAFEYCTDLFSPSTIDRFIDNFLTFLENIIANPDRSLESTPLLHETEKQKLLHDWNQTSVPYPEELPIHALFEQQVESIPNKPAVMFNGEEVTYADLNKRSNQLANYLTKEGVTTGSIIGICLERSIEMVVGLLGILKAGATYVPLDPDYPSERLAYMISDTQMPILLTQSDLADNLPEHDAKAIYIDTQWSEIEYFSGSNSNVLVTPDTLAYMIYTSGSTGKPKGVKVHHQAVVNFLNSMSKKPGLSSSDKLLAVTTLSFDIAVLEIFMPIVKGATTIILDQESTYDGEVLKDKLEETGATIMQATPSTWRLLLGAGWEGSNKLKILCGGEPFPRDLVRELLPKCNSLWNMYGPTETTIWSTCYKISDPEGPILVGRPIDNTTIYILDSKMKPTPIGVPGELCIGGVGVTKGYHNRPELTEKQFVIDDFAGEDSVVKLYRTGDLARYHEDGNIEHLNRIDSQVKVRGFRIELGEIEAALATHDAVKQAVALVKELRPGDQRLIAYLVFQPGRMLNVTEIRKHLQATLPEYMIPQHVVEMQKFPLTPAGKVDRKSLPEPFSVSTMLDNEYLPPRSEIEKILGSIWEELLGVETVSVHDNFFEIGGHSLLSVQAVANIKKQTDVKIDLRTILLDNLEQIASHIEKELSISNQEPGKDIVNKSNATESKPLMKKLTDIFK